MSSPDANPLTGERYDHPELGAFQREFKANWETWSVLAVVLGFWLCFAVYALIEGVDEIIVKGRTDWIIFSIMLAATVFFIYMIFALRPRLLAVAIYDDGFLTRERAGETVFRWSDIVRVKEFLLEQKGEEFPHLLVQSAGEIDFVVNKQGIVEYQEFLTIMRKQVMDHDVEWLDLGVTDSSEVFS